MVGAAGAKAAVPEVPGFSAAQDTRLKVKKERESEGSEWRECVRGGNTRM